eukprot:COSAG01_NODE_1418_length_10375_cov_38.842254_9_plen_107_part_00
MDVAGEWEGAVYGALVAVGTVRLYFYRLLIALLFINRYYQYYLTYTMRLVAMGQDVHSVGGCLTHDRFVAGGVNSPQVLVAVSAVSVYYYSARRGAASVKRGELEA